MGKRDAVILAGAILLALAGVLTLLGGQALPTAGWGISFRQEGQPPVGNADAGELAKYDAAYLDTSGEKVLYLTFDAGYENGYTEQILEALQAQQVPAAFFWWAITCSAMGIWCGGWWPRGIPWAITPCTTRI